MLSALFVFPFFWFLGLVGAWLLCRFPSVQARLRVTHGAQIGIVWALLLLASAVGPVAFFGSLFAGADGAAALLMLGLPAAWGSVMGLTWRWATPRGRTQVPARD